MSDKEQVPEATPQVVDRATFQAALDQQVILDKQVTKLGDQAAAARRRMPMVEVPDSQFTGPDGPVRLTDLFDGHYLLVLQHFMYAPD